MTPLEAIEAHLEKELKRLRAGGECPTCFGNGHKSYVDTLMPCPECKGTKRDPAITQAEEALKLCRDERKRVERLLGWVKGAAESYPARSFNPVSQESFIAALAEYNAPVQEKEPSE